MMKFLGPMASVSTRLLRPQLLFLLLVLVAIRPSACNVDSDASEVSDAVSSGQVGTMGTATRGIKAALIHRNHYSLRETITGAEKSRSSVDPERSQRRLRSRHLADQLIDLESPLAPDPTFGSYYMNISLGTPPQNFVVMADTGSDLPWVQCLPGQTYYNDTHGAFDASKSSTYTNLSCASSACEILSPVNCDYSSSALKGSECVYVYTYGIGVTNGTLAEETLQIGILEGGTQPVPNFQFGCAHNATKGFGKADGLFGLGRGEISFPSQLGSYFGSAFSYCLVNRSRLETETSPLIFGDAALSATAANGSQLQLQYTPILNNTSGGIQSFYYVDLESITVDGVAASIPQENFAIADDGTGGFIFDSGTSYTQLVDEAFQTLYDKLSSAITQYKPLNYNETSVGLELCYNATWESWASEHGKTVPAVSFRFGNDATFDLAVGNLWQDFILLDGTPLVCMAIARASFATQNIFGNWQQMDHYVVHDLGKQQIGFATTVCEN